MYLPDRQSMIRAFRMSRTNPWLVTVVYSDGRATRQIFFKSGKSAAIFSARVQHKSHVERAPVYQLDIDNVDIGLMQVNWHYHGKQFSSIEQMSSVQGNVMYAARLLSRLIGQYGIFKGVGYYHNRETRRWRHYYRQVRQAYLKITGAKG